MPYLLTLYLAGYTTCPELLWCLFGQRFIFGGYRVLRYDKLDCASSFQIAAANRRQIRMWAHGFAALIVTFHTHLEELCTESKYRLFMIHIGLLLAVFQDHFLYERLAMRLRCCGTYPQGNNFTHSQWAPA